MNHNEDIAYNSIKIMSNTDSYSKNSGSLIVNGGIGCKNTIHCEHLCSNSICIDFNIILHLFFYKLFIYIYIYIYKPL